MSTMPFDPYATLGIERDASPAEVRRAFRVASRQVHPDTGGSHESFLLIRAAYELLGDPDARADYDRLTSTPAEAQPTGTTPVDGRHRCHVTGCTRHHLIGSPSCWLHAGTAERERAISASGRVRCVFVDTDDRPCRVVLSAETLISGVPHVCGLHGPFLYDSPRSRDVV
jgi:hypothetical protein